VLIGELLVADETQLLRLAAVMRECGLLQELPTGEVPETAVRQARQATLHYLRQRDTDEE
jgi:hypothetical protein